MYPAIRRPWRCCGAVEEPRRCDHTVFYCIIPESIEPRGSPRKTKRSANDVWIVAGSIEGRRRGMPFSPSCPMILNSTGAGHQGGLSESIRIQEKTRGPAWLAALQRSNGCIQTDAFPHRKVCRFRHPRSVSLSQRENEMVIEILQNYARNMFRPPSRRLPLTKPFVGSSRYPHWCSSTSIAVFCVTDRNDHIHSSRSQSSKNCFPL